MATALCETRDGPTGAQPGAAPTLWLASRSPQRAQLLHAAGFDFTAFDPPYADPADPNRVVDAPAGASRACWLAQRKAASVSQDDLPGPRGARGVLLTADTLVVDAEGALIGTPESAEQAVATLRRLRSATHTIATGVCLQCVGGAATSFLVTAEVTFGPLDDALLEAYGASAGWQGKAGGYNLDEREHAGWPIAVEGDRAAVMGLPMAELVPRLATLGVSPRKTWAADALTRKDSATDG